MTLRRLGELALQRADVLEAIVGLALVVAGLWLWSVAAALVVAGAALFLLAIWPHLRRP